MKVYTVCARAQASIVLVFWPFSPKKLPNCWRNLNDERWSSEWSKVKTLEDNQGVDGPFFTNCVRNIIEKAVSICVIIPKNRKVKKFQLHIIDQSFEHNGMDISHQKRLESLDLNKAVHTSCKHVSEGFVNFIPKRDRPVNSRHVNPPRDHLDYRRWDNMQR